MEFRISLLSLLFAELGRIFGTSYPAGELKKVPVPSKPRHLQWDACCTVPLSLRQGRREAQLFGLTSTQSRSDTSKKHVMHKARQGLDATVYTCSAFTAGTSQKDWQGKHCKVTGATVVHFQRIDLKRLKSMHFESWCWIGRRLVRNAVQKGIELVLMFLTCQVYALLLPQASQLWPASISCCPRLSGSSVPATALEPKCLRQCISARMVLTVKLQVNSLRRE